MRSKLFIVLAFAGGAVASSGSAQDVSADPTFATITLNAGFRPDPQTIPVVSGGEVSADDLGGDCTGFIANVPDVRINYTGGDFPLIFRVTSEADTTLAINAPNGEWYCDDDGSGDLNPMFTFKAPDSGAYDVFIGSYDEEDGADATLSISELSE